MKTFEQFLMECGRVSANRIDMKKGWDEAIQDFQAIKRVRFIKGITPFCQGYNAYMREMDSVPVPDYDVGDRVGWNVYDSDQSDIITGVDYERQRYWFADERYLRWEDAIPVEKEETPQTPETPTKDYFQHLVERAYKRADAAMHNFPQPNYVLNKLSEEHGEVVKGVVHYTEGRETWENVEEELVDNLAMLIRLVTEGDQVIGFTLPDSVKYFKGD